MRSTTLLAAAALAVVAVANPVVKREVVTEYEYVTKVVYVTAVVEPTIAAPVKAQGAALTTKTHRWPGGDNLSVRSRTRSSTEAAVGTPHPTTETAPPAETTAQSAPAPAAKDNLSDYAKEVLEHHNMHRANHSAGPLSWNDELATWAGQAADKCSLVHSRAFGDGDYGINTAAGMNNTASAVTNWWYNNEVEEWKAYYGQKGPPSKDVLHEDRYAHFTQLVWVETTSVGCAYKDCTGSGRGANGVDGVDNKLIPPFLSVCFYKIRGNVVPHFHTNVLPPINMAAHAVKDNLS